MLNLEVGTSSTSFPLGSIEVRPRERVLQRGPKVVTVEPLVMQLLVGLSSRAGALVSRRDLFELCWGSAPVGDDSLNRIVAVLRQAIKRTGANEVRVETIPGAGYVLRFAPGSVDGSNGDATRQVQLALDASRDSWRLGLPQPDYLCLEQLRLACALDPSNASVWGALALTFRHAAEYDHPAAAANHVRECEAAAHRALAIDPDQPEARTALVSVVPLFGHWGEARNKLLTILERSPDCVVAAQDLATLEMATGRVRAGKILRDRLRAADPLAATICYKSVYMHWSVGDLTGMDHIADRASQLWPTHPAVWMVRLWTLAYTGRVSVALAMLADTVARPQVPAPAMQFLREVLEAVACGAPHAIEQAVSASKRLALTGPANANAALFALGLMDRSDEAFAVAEGLYFGTGVGPVPTRHTAAEPSLNEQHRRLTQILFTPVFGRWRDDPRFMAICDRIGLCRYWEEEGLTPDFALRPRC